MKILPLLISLLTSVGISSCDRVSSPTSQQNSTYQNVETEQSVAAQEIGGDLYCPTVTEEKIGEALSQAAFYETQNFYAFICRDSANALYYYGVSKDRENPSNYIILPIESTSPSFIAKNQDTVYSVNTLTLVVSEGEREIVREPVIQSKVTTPDLLANQASEPMSQLTNTAWQLMSLNGQSVPDQNRPTLSFEQERLNGSAGCNNYFASFQVDGDRIEIQNIGSTRKICEGLMERETQYLSGLQQAGQYKLKNNQLEISTPEGSLVFSAV